MPRVDFGEKTHFDGGGSKFLELKVKDQKFHIRFLGSAVYEGKHFFQLDGGKWEIVQCPRIMHDKECAHCEKFFEAKKQMKVMKDEFGEVDSMDAPHKAQFKGYEAVAKKFGVTTVFYYPVLNRETEEAGILKCSTSIRWALDEEFSNGVRILDFDYIVKRTEVPGKYYTLTRMDSATIKPFTEKENAEIDKALGWDLEDIVNGKKSSMELEQPEEAVVEPAKAEEPTVKVSDQELDEILTEFEDA